MKVLTLFNNKGGVGKTTLAVNIAAYLSIEKNKKILFLDLDPQSNSTQMIVQEDMWGKIYGPKPEYNTIYDYFSSIEEGDSNLEIKDISITKESTKYNIDLIAGHPNLSLIEDILSSAWATSLSGDIGGFRKTNWLNLIKKHYTNNYDFLIIDVGPSLGALNRTVLLNTDYFLTPMGSDIFSLLGIDNIHDWISKWQVLYSQALANFKTNNKGYLTLIEKYSLNNTPNQTTKYLGYSTQQYVTKTFKDGRRPIKAYESIISEIPEKIISTLGSFANKSLKGSDLSLGDIPFLYSIVPLAQSNNIPMFNLSYQDGIRGQQSSSVEKYKEMINIIVNQILKNINTEDNNEMA